MSGCGCDNCACGANTEATMEGNTKTSYAKKMVRFNKTKKLLDKKKKDK
jgi:hypothetical protein